MLEARRAEASVGLLELLKHGIIELPAGFDLMLHDVVLDRLSAFSGDHGTLRGVFRSQEIFTP